jgi:shikimate kinase
VRHLVVVGMMGVGKTTTAELVAERLGRPVRDSDRDVERLTGLTGAELDAAGRVDDLHRLEEAVLLGALAVDEPTVIAAAGWVVESALCREVLARRARVVSLRLPVGRLEGRIAAGEHRRTISPDDLRAIDARRRTWFDAVADLTVDATRPPDAIADLIADWW